MNKVVLLIFLSRCNGCLDSNDSTANESNGVNQTASLTHLEWPEATLYLDIFPTFII